MPMKRQLAAHTLRRTRPCQAQATRKPTVSAGLVAVNPYYSTRVFEFGRLLSSYRTCKACQKPYHQADVSLERNTVGPESRH